MSVTPRRPDDDPGYEVVDEPPPRPKNPAGLAIPAKPAAKVPVKSKVVTEDPGFEVVDSPPQKKQPKVSVAADDTVEEPRAKAGTKRSRLLDDADGALREAGERVDERDLSQFNDLKPGKKKLSAADRKRIRAEKRRLEREEREKSAEEWLFPSVIFGIGILLSLAAAALVAYQNTFAGIAVVVLLIVTVIESVILIPVAVGALMLVGKVCGIEYGTLTHTVRSLASIIAIDIGIYWLGAALSTYAMCVAWPIALVLGFVTTYGLFMKYFDVDAMEARISIGAINFVTFFGTIAGWILAGLLVAVLVSSARPAGDADPDEFDSDPPVEMQQQKWKEPGKAKGKWESPDDLGDDGN